MDKGALSMSYKTKLYNFRLYKMLSYNFFFSSYNLDFLKIIYIYLVNFYIYPSCRQIGRDVAWWFSCTILKVSGCHWTIYQCCWISPSFVSWSFHISILVLSWVTRSPIFWPERQTPIDYTWNACPVSKSTWYPYFGESKNFASWCENYSSSLSDNEKWHIPECFS